MPKSLSRRSVRFASVDFSFSDAEDVFRGATFHLVDGWTGLVGDNGAGKTTLLRLIAGELEPTAGSVVIEPDGATVVMCRQTVEELEADVVALAERTDSRANRLRGELALEADELTRWSTLSPGERRRWQIGAALAAEPDVLLLDEPTNHVDADVRALLVSSLARFNGLGVLVSHDRAILGGLTESTLRVHASRVSYWTGAYEVAQREWSAADAARRDEYRRLRDEQRRLEVRLADARREQAAADAQRSARARMRDKNDHDARSKRTKNMAAAAEKKAGRMTRLARNMVDRASESASAVTWEKELGRSIFVDYEPAPMSRLCSLEVEEVSVGGHRLFGRTHVAVQRDSRIRIEGPNGIGKTTLVLRLLANKKVPAERLLYMPQEMSEAEASSLLVEVRKLPPIERGRVFSIVAALGVDPERLLASEQPSPGEARKLQLALGLGRHVWLLVLDEPTNHQDLESIERMERALGSYPGALVLVTHDEMFARDSTAVRWRLAKDGLHIEACDS